MSVNNLAVQKRLCERTHKNYKNIYLVHFIFEVDYNSEKNCPCLTISKISRADIDPFLDELRIRIIIVLRRSKSDPVFLNWSHPDPIL